MIVVKGFNLLLGTHISGTMLHVCFLCSQVMNVLYENNNNLLVNYYIRILLKFNTLYQ